MLLSRLPRDIGGYVKTCASIVESNHLLNSSPFCPPRRGDHNPSTAGNFIYEQLVQQLRVKLIPVKPPFRINALDGQTLGTGHVTRMTKSITLQIGLLHSEVIQFHLKNPSSSVTAG